MSAVTFILLSGNGDRREAEKERCDQQVMPGFNHQAANPEQRNAYASCVERFYPPERPRNDPFVSLCIAAVVFLILCLLVIRDIRR